MNSFIEEDEIIVDDISQLQLTDHTAYVDVYYQNKSMGICIVWYDAEMDERRYVPINNQIVYLDEFKNWKKN